MPKSLDKFRQPPSRRETKNDEPLRYWTKDDEFREPDDWKFSKRNLRSNEDDPEEHWSGVEKKAVHENIRKSGSADDSSRNIEDWVDNVGFNSNPTRNQRQKKEASPEQLYSALDEVEGPPSLESLKKTVLEMSKSLQENDKKMDATKQKYHSSQSKSHGRQIEESSGKKEGHSKGEHERDLSSSNTAGRLRNSGKFVDHSINRVALKSGANWWDDPRSSEEMFDFKRGDDDTEGEEKYEETDLGGSELDDIMRRVKRTRNANGEEESKRMFHRAGFGESYHDVECEAPLQSRKRSRNAFDENINLLPGLTKSTVRQTREVASEKDHDESAGQIIHETENDTSDDDKREYQEDSSVNRENWQSNSNESDGNVEADGKRSSLKSNINEHLEKLSGNVINDGRSQLNAKSKLADSLETLPMKSLESEIKRNLTNALQNEEMSSIVQDLKKLTRNVDELKLSKKDMANFTKPKEMHENVKEVDKSEEQNENTHKKISNGTPETEDAQNQERKDIWYNPNAGAELETPSVSKAEKKAERMKSGNETDLTLSTQNSAIDEGNTTKKYKTISKLTAGSEGHGREGSELMSIISNVTEDRAKLEPVSIAVVSFRQEDPSKKYQLDKTVALEDKVQEDKKMVANYEKDPNKNDPAREEESKSKLKDGEKLKDHELKNIQFEEPLHEGVILSQVQDGLGKPEIFGIIELESEGKVDNKEGSEHLPAAAWYVDLKQAVQDNHKEPDWYKEMVKNEDSQHQSEFNRKEEVKNYNDITNNNRQDSALHEMQNSNDEKERKGELTRHDENRQEVDERDNERHDSDSSSERYSNSIKVNDKLNPQESSKDEEKEHSLNANYKYSEDSNDVKEESMTNRHQVSDKDEENKSSLKYKGKENQILSVSDQEDVRMNDKAVNKANYQFPEESGDLKENGMTNHYKDPEKYEEDRSSLKDKEKEDRALSIIEQEKDRMNDKIVNKDISNRMKDDGYDEQDIKTKKYAEVGRKLLWMTETKRRSMDAEVKDVGKGDLILDRRNCEKSEIIKGLRRKDSQGDKADEGKDKLVYDEERKIGRRILRFVKNSDVANEGISNDHLKYNKRSERAEGSLSKKYQEEVANEMRNELVHEGESPLGGKKSRFATEDADKNLNDKLEYNKRFVTRTTDKHRRKRGALSDRAMPQNFMHSEQTRALKEYREKRSDNENDRNLNFYDVPKYASINGGNEAEGKDHKEDAAMGRLDKRSSGNEKEPDEEDGDYENADDEMKDLDREYDDEEDQSAEHGDDGLGGLERQVRWSKQIIKGRDPLRDKVNMLIKKRIKTKGKRKATHSRRKRKAPVVAVEYYDYDSEIGARDEDSPMVEYEQETSALQNSSNGHGVEAFRRDADCNSTADSNESSIPKKKDQNQEEEDKQEKEKQSMKNKHPKEEFVGDIIMAKSIKKAHTVAHDGITTKKPKCDGETVDKSRLAEEDKISRKGYQSSDNVKDFVRDGNAEAAGAQWLAEPADAVAPIESEDEQDGPEYNQNVHRRMQPENIDELSMNDPLEKRRERENEMDDGRRREEDEIKQDNIRPLHDEFDGQGNEMDSEKRSYIKSRSDSEVEKGWQEDDSDRRDELVRDQDRKEPVNFGREEEGDSDLSQEEDHRNQISERRRFLKGSTEEERGNEESNLLEEPAKGPDIPRSVIDSLSTLLDHGDSAGPSNGERAYLVISPTQSKEPSLPNPGNTSSSGSNYLALKITDDMFKGGIEQSNPAEEKTQEAMLPSHITTEWEGIKAVNEEIAPPFGNAEHSKSSISSVKRRNTHEDSHSPHEVQKNFQVPAVLEGENGKTSNDKQSAISSEDLMPESFVEPLNWGCDLENDIRVRFGRSLKAVNGPSSRILDPDNADEMKSDIGLRPEAVYSTYFADAGNSSHEEKQRSIRTLQAFPVDSFGERRNPSDSHWGVLEPPARKYMENGQRNKQQGRSIVGQWEVKRNVANEDERFKAGNTFGHLDDEGGVSVMGTKKEDTRGQLEMKKGLPDKDFYGDETLKTKNSFEELADIKNDDSFGEIKSMGGHITEKRSMDGGNEKLTVGDTFGQTAEQRGADKVEREKKYTNSHLMVKRSLDNVDFNDDEKINTKNSFEKIGARRSNEEMDESKSTKGHMVEKRKLADIGVDDEDGKFRVGNTLKQISDESEADGIGVAKEDIRGHLVMKRSLTNEDCHADGKMKTMSSYEGIDATRNNDRKNKSENIKGHRLVKRSLSEIGHDKNEKSEIEKATEQTAMREYDDKIEIAEEDLNKNMKDRSIANGSVADRNIYNKDEKLKNEQTIGQTGDRDEEDKLKMEMENARENKRIESKDQLNIMRDKRNSANNNSTHDKVVAEKFEGTTDNKEEVKSVCNDKEIEKKENRLTNVEKWEMNAPSVQKQHIAPAIEKTKNSIKIKEKLSGIEDISKELKTNNVDKKVQMKIEQMAKRSNIIEETPGVKNYSNTELNLYNLEPNLKSAMEMDKTDLKLSRIRRHSNSDDYSPASSTDLEANYERKYQETPSRPGNENRKSQLRLNSMIDTSSNNNKWNSDPQEEIYTFDHNNHQNLENSRLSRQQKYSNSFDYSPSWSVDLDANHKQKYQDIRRSLGNENRELEISSNRDHSLIDRSSNNSKWYSDPHEEMFIPDHNYRETLGNSRLSRNQKYLNSFDYSPPWSTGFVDNQKQKYQDFHGISDSENQSAGFRFNKDRSMVHRSANDHNWLSDPREEMFASDHNFRDNPRNFEESRNRRYSKSFNSMSPWTMALNTTAEKKSEYTHGSPNNENKKSELRSNKRHSMMHRSANNHNWYTDPHEKQIESNYNSEWVTNNMLGKEQTFKRESSHKGGKNSGEKKKSKGEKTQGKSSHHLKKTEGEQLRGFGVDNNGLRIPGSKRHHNSHHHRPVPNKPLLQSSQKNHAHNGSSTSSKVHGSKPNLKKTMFPPSMAKTVARAKGAVVEDNYRGGPVWNLDDDGGKVLQESVHETSTFKSDQESQKKKITVLLAADNLEDESQMDLALHGELAGKIVERIFEQVQRNEALKVSLGPGLYRKHKPEDSVMTDKIYRQGLDEDEVKHTEAMMRRVMELLGRLILDEVQRKTCASLPPDMRDFLQWMLGVEQEESQSEQQPPLPLVHTSDNLKHKEEKFLFEDPSQYKGNVDLDELYRKVRLLKSLITEYNALTEREKTKVETVHDYLVRQLGLLVQYIEERESGEKNKKDNEQAGLSGIGEHILEFQNAPKNRSNGSNEPESTTTMPSLLNTSSNRRFANSSMNIDIVPSHFTSRNYRARRRQVRNAAHKPHGHHKKHKHHKHQHKHKHKKHKHKFQGSPEYNKLIRRVATMRQKRANLYEDDWNPFDSGYEEPTIYSSSGELAKPSNKRETNKNDYAIRKNNPYFWNNDLSPKLEQDDVVNNIVDMRRRNAEPGHEMVNGPGYSGISSGKDKWVDSPTGKLNEDDGADDRHSIRDDRSIRNVRPGREMVNEPGYYDISSEKGKWTNGLVGKLIDNDGIHDRLDDKSDRNSKPGRGMVNEPGYYDVMNGKTEWTDNSRGQLDKDDGMDDKHSVLNDRTGENAMPGHEMVNGPNYYDILSGNVKANINSRHNSMDRKDDYGGGELKPDKYSYDHGFNMNFNGENDYANDKGQGAMTDIQEDNDSLEDLASSDLHQRQTQSDSGFDVRSSEGKKSGSDIEEANRKVASDLILDGSSKSDIFREHSQKKRNVLNSEYNGNNLVLGANETGLEPRLREFNENKVIIGDPGDNRQISDEGSRSVESKKSSEVFPSKSEKKRDVLSASVDLQPWLNPHKDVRMFSDLMKGQIDKTLNPLDVSIHSNKEDADFKKQMESDFQKKSLRAEPNLTRKEANTLRSSSQVRERNLAEDEVMLLNKREAWRNENEQQLEEVAFGEDMRGKLREKEQFEKLTELGRKKLTDDLNLREKRDNEMKELKNGDMVQIQSDVKLNPVFVDRNIGKTLTSTSERIGKATDDLKHIQEGKTIKDEQIFEISLLTGEHDDVEGVKDKPDTYLANFEKKINVYADDDDRMKRALMSCSSKIDRNTENEKTSNSKNIDGQTNEIILDEKTAEIKDNKLIELSNNSKITHSVANLPLSYSKNDAGVSLKKVNPEKSHKRSEDHLKKSSIDRKEVHSSDSFKRNLDKEQFMKEYEQRRLDNLGKP